MYFNIVSLFSTNWSYPYTEIVLEESFSANNKLRHSKAIAHLMSEIVFSINFIADWSISKIRLYFITKNVCWIIKSPTVLSYKSSYYKAFQALQRKFFYFIKNSH